MQQRSYKLLRAQRHSHDRRRSCEVIRNGRQLTLLQQLQAAANGLVLPTFPTNLALPD